MQRLASPLTHGAVRLLRFLDPNDVDALESGVWMNVGMSRERAPTAISRHANRLRLHPPPSIHRIASDGTAHSRLRKPNNQLELASQSASVNCHPSRPLAPVSVIAALTSVILSSLFASARLTYAQVFELYGFHDVLRAAGYGWRAVGARTRRRQAGKLRSVIGFRAGCGLARCCYAGLTLFCPAMHLNTVRTTYKGRAFFFS